MAELTQFRRKRSGYKSVINKLCKKIEELLRVNPEEEQQRDTAEELKDEITATNDTLIEKESIIKELDGKIIDLMQDDDEFEKEIEQTTEYEITLKTLHEKVRSRLTKTTTTIKRTESVFSTQSEENLKTNVKLPKLTLNKFNGDPTKWYTFYETFNAAVHSNESLSKVEKFTYLKNYVEKEAAQAIRGFSLTGENYEKSLTLLQERFGNTKLIISSHINNLLSLKPVTSDRDVKGLRILYDTAEAEARSLESLGIESEKFGAFLAPIIVDKLPHQIKLFVSRQMQEWDVVKLLKILKQELLASEASVSRDHSNSNDGHSHHNNHNGRNYSQPPFPGDKQAQGRPVTASTLFSGSPSCVFCKGPHYSDKCQVVSDSESRINILKRDKRCFMCLKTSHRSKNCDRKKSCYYCKGYSHNSAICQKQFQFQFQTEKSGSHQHQDENVPSCLNSGETIAVLNQNSGSGESNSRYVNKFESDLNVMAPEFYNNKEKNHAVHVGEKNKFILQTAECIVYNPKTKTRKTIRILLDSGSTRTYITNDLKSFLNLEPSCVEDISMLTFGNKKTIRKSVDLVKVLISRNLEANNEIIEVEALSVPFICAPLATNNMSVLRKCEHLRKLQLADTATGSGCVKIDMLIGMDFYWSIVTGKVIKGKSGEPTAMSTKLGWVVSGSLVSVSENNFDDCTTYTNTSVVHTLLIDWSGDMNSVEDQLHKFWDLESIGIKNSEKGTIDDVIENISLNDEKRYEVSLPFKESHPVLPDNYTTCEKRLYQLQKKLKKDPERLKQYDAVFQEQLRLGVIEKVTEAGELGETHYLPHHGIVRNDKDSTKLRVVMDASSKPSKSEPSLNDCLYKGPNMTPLLFEILMRLRVFPIALTADIEKAFLQINVTENERDYLRFLWFENPTADNPKIIRFRFTRVVFGVTSSPFLLNGTLRKHAIQYTDVDPEFVLRVLKAFFVDDFTGGEFTIEAAIEYYKKLKLRYLEGNFNLRKWRTNNEELRQAIKENEPDDLASSSETHNRKHLGVIWNDSDDLLGFDFTQIIEEADANTPTKRSILRIISKFYDPLGLIQPIIVSLKVLFQNLCKEKLTWDENLPDHLLNEWVRIRKHLHTLTELFIQRCYLINEISDPFTKYELHGFSDASLQAYGACMYIRGITHSGNIKCSLISSKSRVAPMKTVTIPRLELLGNLVLSRLYVTISSVLIEFYNVERTVLWTDSQITLAWICSVNKEYKVFVENRVQEIRKLTKLEWWKYCNTNSNPADLITRSWNSPCNLINESFWWNGPAFLHQPEEQWQPAIENNEIDDTELEIKTVTLLVTSDEREKHSIEQLINIDNFSCVQKMYRVTAWTLRYLNNLKLKIKKKPEHLSSVLSTDEVRTAEDLWIKVNQSYLTEELSKKDVKQNLGVIRDEKGIIRCSGRLKHAPLPYESRNPILLSRTHRLTLLLVRQYHNRVNHAGEKHTLTELRERFWICKGRSFVRKIVLECITCRRINTKSYDSPITPPLPALRLNNGRAFSTVGVDNFGPLHVKDVYSKTNKMIKAWGVIYTCAASRGILLDLSPDTSDDAFIRSFSRFISRRGAPDHVISDNGGNFIANQTKLYSTGRNIQWHFNLPLAPWHGGFFERLIRIVKDMLKKQLKNARLSYEELQTVFLEIERIVNKNLPSR